MGRASWASKIGENILLMKLGPNECWSLSNAVFRSIATCIFWFIDQNQTTLIEANTFTFQIDEFINKLLWLNKIAIENEVWLNPFSPSLREVLSLCHSRVCLRGTFRTRREILFPLSLTSNDDPRLTTPGHSSCCQYDDDVVRPMTSSQVKR